MTSPRIVPDDPVRRQPYGTPIICTLRGSLPEREQLTASARRARLSLNAYIRRRCGLPDTPAQTLPTPALIHGAGI